MRQVSRLVHVLAGEVLGEAEVALGRGARVEVDGASPDRARSLDGVDAALEVEHAGGSHAERREARVRGGRVVGVEIQDAEAFVLIRHRLGVPGVRRGFVDDAEQFDIGPAEQGAQIRRASRPRRLARLGAQQVP
nr:hypothetical protein [Nocardia amikacinitolerans]